MKRGDVERDGDKIHVCMADGIETLSIEEAVRLAQSLLALAKQQRPPFDEQLAADTARRQAERGG